MNIEELNKIILLNKQGLLSDEALAYTIEEIYKVGKASDNLEEKKMLKKKTKKELPNIKEKLKILRPVITKKHIGRIMRNTNKLMIF